MQIFVCALSAGLLVASPPTSWGAEPADPFDDAAKTVNAAATTPPGQGRVATRLAQELNASWGVQAGAYSATSLEAQRGQTGWGWGEIMIANLMAQALARKTGISLTQATAQITASRQQGMGWGTIAKASDLKVGAVVGSAQKTAAEIEKAEKAAKGAERSAEKAAKGAEKASEKGGFGGQAAGKSGGEGPGGGKGGGEGHGGGGGGGAGAGGGAGGGGGGGGGGKK